MCCVSCELSLHLKRIRQAHQHLIIRISKSYKLWSSLFINNGRCQVLYLNLFNLCRKIPERLESMSAHEICDHASDKCYHRCYKPAHSSIACLGIIYLHSKLRSEIIPLTVRNINIQGLLLGIAAVVSHNILKRINIVYSVPIQQKIQKNTYRRYKQCRYYSKSPLKRYFSHDLSPIL